MSAITYALRAAQARKSILRQALDARRPLALALASWEGTRLGNEKARQVACRIADRLPSGQVEVYLIALHAR